MNFYVYRGECQRQSNLTNFNSQAQTDCVSHAPDGITAHRLAVLSSLLTVWASTSDATST